MEFPDFSTSLRFVRLRQQMNAHEIPPLPRVRFTRQVPRKIERDVWDKTDQELLEELRGSKGREVEVKDIKPNSAGLLTLDGREVVAYIRDQKGHVDPEDGTSGYRFHLCDCYTLRHMRKKKRERRYVATQRTDGKFEVRYRKGWRGWNTGDLALDLCLNCKDHLGGLGIVVEPFSLVKYFERYNSMVPKTVRRIEDVPETQTYQPNQAELAREYKEAVGHTCQLCRVKCPPSGGLLDLHHHDGDPSHNQHENLSVLCIDCHSKQPYHSQVSQPEKAKERIREIEKLRREQGLL